MRWVSNQESVAKGEVSMLAIAETLLAITLVFYLAAHFNTLRWLAFAICVSPLLLLRTEESTRLGIDWWDRWVTWEERWDYQGDKLVITILWAIAVIVIACAVAFAIRAAATVVGVLSNPACSLRAIPQNWSRVTLAMDSRFPPEFIPGHPSETLQSTLEGMTGLPLVAALLFLVPPFVPAIIYRWSLKATSIIYAPLVFVAQSTFSEGTDVRTKLQLIKRSDLSRIRALFGIVTIIAFLTKVILMMKWNGFVAAWKGNPIVEFLSLYVAPAEIPKWQLAEVANSVLAVGVMFFARYALLRYELNKPLWETPIKRIIGFVSGLRWTLALYAIVCTGYITIREARHWNLPPLGQKWIPWA
jgi:hypothetical protein